MDRRQTGSNARLDTSQYILKTNEQELSEYPMPSDIQRHSLIQNDQAMSSYYSKTSFGFAPQGYESNREATSLGPVPSKHLLTMKALAYTNHPLYKPSFQQLSGRGKWESNMQRLSQREQRLREKEEIVLSDSFSSLRIHLSQGQFPSLLRVQGQIATTEMKREYQIAKSPKMMTIQPIQEYLPMKDLVL